MAKPFTDLFDEQIPCSLHNNNCADLVGALDFVIGSIHKTLEDMGKKGEHVSDLVSMTSPDDLRMASFCTLLVARKLFPVIINLIDERCAMMSDQLKNMAFSVFANHFANVYTLDPSKESVYAVKKVAEKSLPYIRVPQAKVLLQALLDGVEIEEALKFVLDNEDEES